MTHPLGWALALSAVVPTTLTYDHMPPERFQGDTGVLQIRFVAEPNAEGACGLSSKGTFQACVRGGVLILPNPCPRGATERFAELTCHEMAHRNGWPDNHGP